MDFKTTNMLNKYSVSILTWTCFGSIIINTFSRKSLMNVYNPTNVNWKLVVKYCNEAFTIEKRYANFFIRLAAHDALAFDTKYGGADGSVILSKDEVARPENKQDRFAHTLSPVAKNISSITDASVADVIAVCGAVAVEYLGGPNMFLINTTTPFFVGRQDVTIPNPHNQLAKGNIDTEDFALLVKTKGLSLKDMVALMGSHVLIDDHNCKNNDGTICDPTIENCDNITMFTWSNMYYKDVCSEETIINVPAIQTTEILTLEQKRKNALCKYTSQKMKKVEEADVIKEDEQLNNYKSTYANVLVECKTKCKPTPTWSYTTNDAYLGKTCQNKKQLSLSESLISKYMREFAENPTSWNQAYAEAYKNMISLRAVWSNKIEIPL